MWDGGKKRADEDGGEEALVVKKKREDVVNKHTIEMYLIPSHPLCFLLFFHTTFILLILHTLLCFLLSFSTRKVFSGRLFCFFRKVDGWGEGGVGEREKRKEWQRATKNRRKENTPHQGVGRRK